MEFNGEALQCRMIEAGVVEMTFDLQNESVNKFNRVTMEEYREVVSLLGKERNLKGLLINSAKEAFIVGADITEFLGFFQIPLDELTEQIKLQQQIFLDGPRVEFLFERHRCTGLWISRGGGGVRRPGATRPECQ